MKKRLVLAVGILSLMATTFADADQDEYVLDMGLGPRLQLLSSDRATGTYNTSIYDLPRPYLGIRYGLTDFARYGAWEIGFSGQYSAQANAKYGGVEWEPKKTGDVLVDIESWNLTLENRFKYGVEYIPYAVLGLGWHRLLTYNIDFITPSGLRIKHYKSQLREVAYVAGGAGFEWRFSNRWSTSIEASVNYDLGERTSQLSFPMRAKLSVYFPD